jgi:hypothetical protein
MSGQCLNCETELQGKFCHQCGQKASTHRMSFSTFIKHDLLHGVLHLDKGILYTLKNLILQPGYAAAGFIKGKRVVHYNIFALFIIVIAVKTIIDAQFSPGEVFNSFESNKKASDETLNEIIKHYYKLFYLLSVPLLSLFSYIFFRQIKYNFIEHIVFNCFFLTGSLFYFLVFSVLSELITLEFISFLSPIFIGIYLYICFYQITKSVYKWYSLLIRTSVVLVLFLAILFIILLMIINIFYGDSFTGNIHF